MLGYHLSCYKYRCLAENSWAVPQKLNIELLFDPAILLLIVYPKELKAVIQTITYTPMFIAAGFIITIFTVCKRKNPCPSISEWDKKCNIYTQWNII